jgi:hypothetical protein
MTIFIRICILLRFIAHSLQSGCLGLGLNSFLLLSLESAESVYSIILIKNDSEREEEGDVSTPSGPSGGQEPDGSRDEEPQNNNEEPENKNEEPQSDNEEPQSDRASNSGDSGISDMSVSRSDITDRAEDPGIGTLEPAGNDMDLVERAQNGDASALLDLKEKYPAFFEGENDASNLENLEDYIAYEAGANPASNSESEIGSPNVPEEESPVVSPTEPTISSKRARSESDSDIEVSDKKRTKINKDDDDSNNNPPKGGGNIGGSNGPAGTSDPSSANEGSSNVRSRLTEILLGLGGILEQ